MTASSFHPTDLEREQDPYPLLARLREASPVLKLDSGFWAVTGYDAAMDALRNPGCRSGPIALRYLDGLPEGAARDEMGHRINFLDPPDHTRVRGLVSKAFTPRRIAALRPWIEATAERLLDELDGGEELDLLSRFAHQLPSLVISELLGVPPADRDQLTGFSDAVAPLLGVSVPDDVKARAIAAAEEFHAYLGALLDERRKQPGDDLLSALLVAEEAGERLQRVELLSLAATLYSAGHRTTRDLFTNGMSVLLSRPERYRNVIDGRWSIAEVIEEFLRYETPTLFVARVPLEPVTVAGTFDRTIRAVASIRLGSEPRPGRVRGCRCVPPRARGTAGVVVRVRRTLLPRSVARALGSRGDAHCDHATVAAIIVDSRHAATLAPARTVSRARFASGTAKLRSRAGGRSLPPGRSQGDGGYRDRLLTRNLGAGTVLQDRAIACRGPARAADDTPGHANQGDHAETSVYRRAEHVP